MDWFCDVRGAEIFLRLQIQDLQDHFTSSYEKLSEKAE